MSYENWESIKECFDKIYAYEWNNIMRIGFLKTDDWIIIPFESEFRAINGENGMAYFQDADAGLVLQDVLDDLPDGGAIGLKGLLLSSTMASWTQNNITLRARSPATELRARASMDSLLDITGAKLAHFDGVFINGYGLATIPVNGAKASDIPAWHKFHNCRIWGGIDADVDLTGCDDSELYQVWLDGRRAEDATLFCDYGLRVGKAGDGGVTADVTLEKVYMMFLKKADAYFKNIVQVNIGRSIFASKPEYGPDLIANLLLEGGTGAGAQNPRVSLRDCWFDGGMDIIPNIVVQNKQITELSMMNCYTQCTNAPNLYSVLNPAMETLEVIGGKMERNAGGYNIDMYITDAMLMNLAFPTGDGIDKTKLTHYLINQQGAGQIDTNLPTVLTNNVPVYMQDSGGVQRAVLVLDSSNVVRIFNPAGAGHIEVQPYVSGGRVKLYNVADGKWLAELDGAWSRFAFADGDPDTTGWSFAEQGRIWFNATSSVFKFWYWDGAAGHIKTISYS